MPRRNLAQLYRDEFRNYTAAKFRQDVLAGVNVAAVALPLALAFGVASGANASAGLVSAIWAGLIMGVLAGAPYQISGPTGAMSAVLILLAQHYGLPGVWAVSVLAGLLLLVIGFLRLGRFIAFIPAPVTTGFTSGIALIIAIGQLGNLLGLPTPKTTSAAWKLIGYFQAGAQIDWHALTLGGLVMAIMLLWPARWNQRLPGSLVGLAAATLLNFIVRWPVPAIGAIPPTLVLGERLTVANFPWASISDLIVPTLSATSLAAIVSLLCGASASSVTGIRLQANQELMAQGVGNLLIPFFGGVPATGAVARTLVGIKSGGQTRVVSIAHSLVLLAFLFALSPVLAYVPLAALAGVLMVTCWRMNQWEAIRYFVARRFKSALITFGVTVLATTIFDLSQTIALGVFLSGAIFLSQIADITITVQAVDVEKLRARGIEISGECQHVRVAYFTGPLFFAATGNFNEAFAHLRDTHALILSMRGVPLIDTSGLQALANLHKRLTEAGGTLMLAGVAEPVLTMLERGGLAEAIGSHNIFWSADQAIVEAERRGCAHCAKKEGD